MYKIVIDHLEFAEHSKKHGARASQEVPFRFSAHDAEDDGRRTTEEVTRKV